MAVQPPAHDPAADRYAPPSETERRTSSPYRVRFDEAGPDGIARASTYLRYAQDVAWLHSERRGFGRPWYIERGLAWVVRAVELTILVPLPTGAGLIATTEVIGGRRVMARRRCDLRAEADGAAIATVITDWVMTTTSGAPTRVPDAFPISFGVVLDSFEPIRIRPAEVAQPAPGENPGRVVSRSFAVRLHELDPMGHVNNAVYLDWLDEAVDLLDPAIIRAVPRRYRLEYRTAAAPGATLHGQAWAADPGWRYRLEDSAGRLCLGGRLEVGTAP